MGQLFLFGIRLQGVGLCQWFDGVSARMRAGRGLVRPAQLRGLMSGKGASAQRFLLHVLNRISCAISVKSLAARGTRGTSAALERLCNEQLFR